MTLTFPRALVFEAYLGRWVNVTELAVERRLLQTDPVTVSWGLPNEQAKALAPPSTATGALRNIGGHWTPGNAMSDYCAYLQARNAPTRLALRVMRDTFTRTVVGDWGFADTETHAWTTSGVNAAFSVGSGSGSIVVSAVSSFGLATGPDSYGDQQVAASCTVNINNITGGSIEPCNLVLRYQGTGPMSGEHYLLRVECTSAEVLNLTIFHNSLGALSSTVVVPGLIDAVSAKTLRAKFQVEGQTLRGKVYKPGPAADPDQFEPLDWQVSCHDERLAGGFPGYRCGVAGGNTNIPVTFLTDDLEVRLLRHTGELSKLSPTTDLTHRIKKAAFTAAGVTMRLGKPNRPALSSAPRRYIPTTSPLAYWPMDDAAYADAVKALVGNTPAQVVSGAASVAAMALNALAPWLGTGLTVVPDSTAVKCIVDGSSATSWCADLMFLPTLTAANATAGPHVVTTDASIWQPYVDMATGTIAMKLNPSGGAQVTLGTTAALPELANGRVHHLRWRTAQNGGNVDWFVYLDGSLVLSGSRAAFTNTANTQIRLFSNNQPCTFGHVAAYSGTGPTLTDVVAACFGYASERALTRAIRLAGEESVPIDYFGSTGSTPPMGPQRPAPLLDQLVECAEAMQGILYEPRYTAGVAIRPRLAMSAQAADATLDYAAGHVAPPLTPDYGDRPTANLIRAERIGGGVIFAEQVTGPMNTQNPGTNADAAGKTPGDVKANVDADAQLTNVAGWALALGTVPDVRYPTVRVDLAAPTLTLGADPTLPARQVLDLRPGDRLVVQNMGECDRYRDLDQLVRGGVETFRNARVHDVTLNTSPYEKYRTATYGDAGSRYSSAVTTLDAQLNVGVTGARNVTTTSGLPWVTAAASFPLDVEVEGERITISGITGSGAAQVMTISARAVNGATKTHPAGSLVRPWQASYYG